MHRTLATLTAVAALSLAPTLTLAQTQPNTSAPPAAAATPAPGSPAPAEKIAPPTTAAAPTLAPATPKFVSAQTADQWLSSNLVGADVVNSSDKSLGEISDLVMEKDGRIVAAVIDVGGFLGIGAKPVAVSFDTLSVVPGKDGPKIVAAMTKEELNQAPEFKTMDEAHTTSPQVN